MDRTPVFRAYSSFYSSPGQDDINAFATSTAGKPLRISLQAILRAVPWFIVWFVVASAVTPFFPEIVSNAARWIAPFMITAALTAIGLTTDIGRMRQTGWRPIALGFLVWVSVASTSLLVQYLTLRW